MRILFVTKAHLPVLGGAQWTTDALARALQARGHDVTVLTSQPVRAGWDVAPGEALPYPVRRSVAVSCDVPGALHASGAECVVAGDFGLSNPVAPVVSAVGDVPTLVYMHDGRPTPLGDALRAPHVGVAAVSRELARRIGGAAATHLPPIVQRERYRVATSRRVALFVTPDRTKGLDTMLALAAARPDIPFAFQRSWPMRPAALAELRAALRALPNVELREAVSDPARLYGDARVLLAPSTQLEGWGRVASEALTSAIPVIARADGGLAEAVGEGGILVAPGAGFDAWLAALGRLWDDGGEYDAAVERAERAGRRDDLQPDVVAQRFEAAVAPLAG